MPAISNRKRDVDSIIKALPLRVAEHMYRIGKLASVLIQKISEREGPLGYYVNNTAFESHSSGAE